jgi:hypothetical protein
VRIGICVTGFALLTTTSPVGAATQAGPTPIIVCGQTLIEYPDETTVVTPFYRSGHFSFPGVVKPVSGPTDAHRLVLRFAGDCTRGVTKVVVAPCGALTVQAQGVGRTSGIVATVLEPERRGIARVYVTRPRTPRTVITVRIG